VIRLPLRDLRRAVEEMAALEGRHVDNLYQCGPRTFLLKLAPGPVWVIADATPGRARMLVTDVPPEAPDAPPVLGQILRRALRGGRVLGAALVGEDRILALDVETAEGRRRLVLEALPRHPNLLLLSGEGEVLRVLDGEAAKHRGNPVGARYRPPPAPSFKEEPSLLPEPPGEGPFAANFALDRLARADIEAGRGGRSEAAREKAIARLRKLRDAVAGDLAALPDPARLREQGRTLLLHYGELKPGSASFQGIALDPKLTPQENVDRIFKTARKSERARPILEARLSELEARLAEADRGGPVEAVQPPRRKAPAPSTRLPYREFTSADGLRILVGKGGEDNDTLTLKLAGPGDVFLHVRGTPGSHVIVPLEKGREIPEQTLLDAASLALHYSKMRLAGAADVTWTLRRNVHKPRGAKPGLVAVRQERVLRIRREPERLARLLATAGGESDEAVTPHA
jgi:predicted ribosome quality control (RQC) complex YloA/Tae2 family protein